ncbi:methenyltetrahydrofolate cyclohydrolase [Natronincola peptidivorans]|uniref:Bifunctional protein FolD n=1 Tax=Natronincola peptidivorans TaxID=426128 RepID=A0A1I0EXP7_9FIRM|nr:tetrahydrofolate dehydrogenase/cyclohydrolase catalytic domain-containing protein [Natronincola peptidivorans]SET50279.1 methenyltetrahydrofolate cyclohydrolase [Natronincola peptidivorans]
MNTIIKGKPVADRMSEKLIKEVEVLKSKSINPKLTIIRVGTRPDDLAYEKGALGRCKKIGIETEVVELPEDVTQKDFVKELKRLNDDDLVNGILIFRPLPNHIDEGIVKYEISPEKDVDCLSPINVGKMIEGDKTGFPPCTPTAVVEILKHYNVDIQGKNIVVLGRSMVVGKPVALLLLNEDATVTVCHSKTKEIDKISSNADIVIAAIGRGRFVKENFVGESAVVIDVGINIDEDEKMCGDIDFDNVKDKASMITPVPGGVGSVTTSILAKHIVKACKQQNNL